MLHYLQSQRFNSEMVAACRHALGDDIVVQYIGSLPKALTSTHGSDIDIQVRRCPGSNQADTWFTETDKLKVAQNLEKCKSVVGPVTIGNIAIKFSTHDAIPVDLVLATPRPEQFPRLRGGEDFYENSARINKCLQRTPAAYVAVLAVKEFWKEDRRPKGILLEAIVWRLSQTYPFPLAEESFLLEPGEEQLSIESFSFFVYVWSALDNWEESPFGSDLKQDLDKLPERERDKYLPGIERFQQCAHVYLLCFLRDILDVAEEECPDGVPTLKFSFGSSSLFMLDPLYTRAQQRCTSGRTWAAP